MTESSYDIPLSNHLAVSQLPPTQTLSDKSLFLVSEENETTRTGFITKRITYERAKKALDRDFSISQLTQQFNDLCAITYPVITNLETNYVSCENIGNLYIISSLYQSDGNITSCFGYRLSAGMDQIFKTVKFDKISVKNLSVTNANISVANINNLSVNNSVVNNLTVNNSATFNNDVTFNKTIIVNGQPLNTAYKIYETEIVDQNKVEISTDTVNVVYLTNKTLLGGSNDLDVVIKGVSPDMALDCELLIHKTNSFIQNQPTGKTNVNLHFRVADETGLYVSNVDFISPNFMSSDTNGNITDDTNLQKLVDTEDATYLYLISQITKSEPTMNNPRFYISRQYLNSIQA